VKSKDKKFEEIFSVSRHLTLTYIVALNLGMGSLDTRCIRNSTIR